MARLYRSKPQHLMTKQERIEVAKALADVQSEKQHLMVIVASFLQKLGEFGEFGETGEQALFKVEDLTALQNKLASGEKTLQFSSKDGIVSVKLV